MNISSKTFAPRLLAGFGTAALVVGVGLFASSRPAHTAGGPIPVTVSNTVQNSDVNNLDKQPFVKTVALTTLNGDSSVASVTVPAGKRLVVETVTAFRSAVANPGVNAQIYLRAQVGGGSGLFAPSTLTASRRIVTEPLRFRADSGNIVVIASLSGPVASEEDDVTLSGYLVDVP